ncbi:MAG: peptidylprolyl isomerase [Synergistaceae bacterium]|nr:peptidylprolyl isomerase [Synergistaceae bacterium]
MSYRKPAAAILMSAVIMIFASCASAEDEKIISVGSESLNASEVLQMLTATAGGNPMVMNMILAQSTLKDRKSMVGQMADALLFAEEAKTKGLYTRPDLAFQIKWQVCQILLKAYLEQISASWDMSEAALHKYYDAHKAEFVVKPAAHVRHILTENEADALNAALKIYKSKDFAKIAAEYSRDPNTSKNGGDLGWVEKGTLDAAVDKAVEEAKIASIVGPVKSEYGWHILEVTERRPQKQMNFDEAREAVIQSVQRTYIDAELKKLKGKYPVTINEKALSNLGGVKAPEEGK